MLLKRLFSMALLLSVAGTTFVMSEQDAEARCCRQRCHHRRHCCNNGSYGYSNYGYAGTSNCNACSTSYGTVAPQPGTYDGTAPTPQPAPSNAPPPAPAT